MKKITSYRIRGRIKKWTMLFGMSLLFLFSAFSQTNIAPLATITANGTGAPGCQTGACSTLNDLNLGTCGTQQMWISTATPPSTTPGDDWIQWDFPSARTFDTLVIHHGQLNTRFLTGATVQYWDGATWVTHSSFSGLPNQCVNRVSIGRLTTDRFRITAFLPNAAAAGQQSNQNFREIEIIEAPTGPNDAAAFSVDSPMVYCSGSQNVVVTIGNLGTNVIDSVDVNWEVNGVAQPTVQYIGTLDTIGGLGLYTAQVNLGNFTFPPGINTLKIYTSNPNGVADTSNANDTIVRFVGPGLSGNYTVDLNAPTGGTNFNSFTELAQALNVLGICGPVNVTVSPGVYNESFHLNSVSGLSSTDTILIDGQSPSQAVLRHDGQGDYAALIYNNVSHVTVQNMTIENNGTGDAVIFKDASHNRLQNNICKVDAVSTSSANYNVVFSSSTSSNSSGTEANHNLIADNHIIGGYYGVYMYGATTNLNTHNRVINNDIDSAYYYGVYGYYQDSLEVENNNIDVSQRGNQNSYGLMIYYSNNTIANANYVRAGYAAGYFYNFNTYSPVNRRYMISNNMFISDGQGQYGVYMYYVDSVDIFHNSINTTGVGSAIFIGGSTSPIITSYDVRNNIFNAATGLAFEVNEPDTIFDKFNNNLYNTGGGSLLNIDGVTYTDLASYQLAQPLLNTASLEGDPQFVSPTNLHIVGAYVNDQGDNSVNITEDIDGDPRPITGSTIVDIGADEYDPPTCPPPFNMGAFNPSLDSITIFWTGNFGVSTYEYEVVPCGSGQGSGTTVVTGLDSIRIGGLMASTCYELYVREICNRGDTSFWVGPTSFNTANGIPYFQDFERWPNNLTGLINEEGWYTNGTPAPHWEVGQSTSSASTGPSADHTIGAGGTFVYLETSGGTTGDDDTLYSPPIYIDTNQTAVQLEFWYHMHGATMGDLEVFVDTNGTLVPVVTISGQQHPVQTDPWLNSVYSLTGFEGKSVQILFVGTRGTSFTGDMAIDDVSLQSVTCPAPNSLTDTIVGVDSVVISWASGGGATNWDLEYGPAGFAQGNGTLLAKTDTFHLVSGLQTNIAYEFYVRDSCGVNDVSAWMGPYSFGIFEACDDMDGYPAGPIGTQSMLIQPWAGAGGDAEFSTDFASSGTQSLKIYDSGLSGFSDAVAVMNPYTSGAWNVSVDIYIPSGFGGYYNILHNYTGGTNVWAIEVYMDSSGVATVQEGTNGTATIGTYSFTVGAWNTIEHIIDLSADTATILVNGNPTNVSWQFSLGSANFGNQFNAFNFFSAANAGQTPLIYFDDFCVSPHLPTSIKKVDAKETSLNFYPNPTAGEFTVSSSGLENNNARLTIRDITGKVVLVDNIANSNSAFTKQYNLSDFAKGMYFISILDGENRINQKLIVQ